VSAMLESSGWTGGGVAWHDSWSSVVGRTDVHYCVADGFVHHLAAGSWVRGQLIDRAEGKAKLLSRTI